MYNISFFKKKEKKKPFQVWFQNARAKFRRNNTRNRDLASVSPRGNQINDIQATSEQVEYFLQIFWSN